MPAVAPGVRDDEWVAPRDFVPRALAGVTVTVPPAGDWGLVVSVAATRDGDTFSVPYYFRIIVEP